MFIHKNLTFLLTLTALLLTPALTRTPAAFAQRGGRNPAPSADQVVRQYLEAWAKKDFDTMYSLTTKEGQRQIAKEEFIRLFSQPYERVSDLELLAMSSLAKDIRLVALYPPRIEGEIAAVPFTVEQLLPDNDLPGISSPPMRRLQRATAYAVVEDNQWRLPMYFDEQGRTWHLPPTAKPPGIDGMMPGMGGVGIPGMPGMPAMPGGSGVGLAGLPPHIRSVLIPIQHVDVTQIAALFGVSGVPMGGMSRVPRMPGMPEMLAMGGMGSGSLGGPVSPPPRVTKGTQDKVSVDFVNSDIREVIDLLFKTKPGTNYVIKEGVQGVVTLKLNNVDWDTVLKFALEKVKARARKDESGIFIIEPDPKFQQGLAPPAGGIPAMGAIPSRPESPAPFAIGSLTLPDGIANIIALPTQNALLVQGTEQGIEELRELIAQIDVPPQQIALEVMLLEMALEDLKELNPSHQTSNVLTPQQVRAALQRLGSKVKVLAKPQVTTLNGIPAEVSAIAQMPGTGRMTEGTRLSFTPRSNQDSTITLHIRIEVFRPSGQNTVSSTATVPNGTAAVISGLPKDGNKVLTVIVIPRIG